MLILMISNLILGVMVYFVTCCAAYLYLFNFEKGVKESEKESESEKETLNAITSTFVTLPAET